MPKPDIDPELQPEVIEHGEVVFPEPNLTDHKWRQKGEKVYCDQCPLTHGFYVGMNTLLTGIDENGYPQFQERKQLPPLPAS